MTFRASCSYAGIANLLSMRGIDTEDREIALEMRLPYLFSHEDGRYLSGPMLQGAKWFDLYLNPLGAALSECRMGREEVLSYLPSVLPAMLGLRVSPESKHAVICTSLRNGKWQFINNKRWDSPEPENFSLTDAGLISRLDAAVTIGTLVPTAPIPTDYRPHLRNSLSVLHALREELFSFCSREQPVSNLLAARDALFRPLFLDGPVMLELLDKTELAARLRAVRRQFLTVVQGERKTLLSQNMDMPLLDSAITDYQDLIAMRLEAE